MLNRLSAVALAFLLATSPPAAADTLVAARNLRAQTIVTAADLGRGQTAIDGALRDPSDALGLETRVTIYAGRPIHAHDLGPPAVVDRNEIIVMVYDVSGLEIVTEGRALERGGIGDRIRVMNMTSRATVTGRITAHGTVEVHN